ncbi:MAG: ABC transporter permease [Candidatus Methanomethylophilaceae archaeon]|nr:ABC transporter permease [Candidatus Methanomethylophilaceae archaeon]
MKVFDILDETYRVAWGDLCYMKENLPEALISSLVGPLLYLLAFGFGISGNMEDSAAYLAFIIPGIIALTTLSSTFSTVSMKILVQRLFYMSFDELLLCPVHITSVILGKCLMGVIRGVMSCTIIMLVGHLLSPSVEISLSVLVVVIVASLTFSMFGMLAGMLTNKTQKLSLFSSIVIVPMTFLCGTLFNVSALPEFASFVIYLLPLTHVSALTRGIMLDTGVPLDSVVFLLVYMLLFFGACYYMIKNNKC